MQEKCKPFWLQPNFLDVNDIRKKLARFNWVLTVSGTQCRKLIFLCSPYWSASFHLSLRICLINFQSAYYFDLKLKHMTCIKDFEHLSNKVNRLSVLRSNFALPWDYTVYDMGFARSIVLCVGTEHPSAELAPGVH